jgi:hypothetical protein
VYVYNRFIYQHDFLETKSVGIEVYLAPSSSKYTRISRAMSTWYTSNLPSVAVRHPSGGAQAYNHATGRENRNEPLSAQAMTKLLEKTGNFISAMHAGIALFPSSVRLHSQTTHEIKSIAQ